MTKLMTNTDKQHIEIEPRHGLKLAIISILLSIVIPPAGIICAIVGYIRIYLNKREQLVDKHDKLCKILFAIALVFAAISTTMLVNWEINQTAPWHLEEERVHTIEIQDALQANLDPLVDISDEDKEIIGQAIQSAFEQSGIDTAALNLTGKELADWSFDNIEYTLDNFELNNREGTATVDLHIKHRDMKTFMETYTATTEEARPANVEELGTIIRSAMDKTEFVTDDLTLHLVDNHNGTWSITEDSMTELVTLLFGGIRNEQNVQDTTDTAAQATAE